MTVTEKAKSAAITTAVSTALNYLEKDPEGNIPKVVMAALFALARPV